jgi:hypothetical protein
MCDCVYARAPRWRGRADSLRAWPLCVRVCVCMWIVDVYVCVYVRAVSVRLPTTARYDPEQRQVFVSSTRTRPLVLGPLIAATTLARLDEYVPACILRVCVCVCVCE